MQIDFFIRFSQCEGICLFCKRGNEIVSFRAWEDGCDPQEYQFFDPPSESAMIAKMEEVSHENPDAVAITGYEPVRYPGIGRILSAAKRIFPRAKIVLRTSGMSEIPDEAIALCDRIELPIYGSAPVIHNMVCGNPLAWKHLQENIARIQEKHPGSIYFQIVAIASNLQNIPSIFSYIESLWNTHPIKVVYPHFMPKDEIMEMVSRSDIIAVLLKNVSPEVLKKYCILSNFPKKSTIVPYFLDVQQ